MSSPAPLETVDPDVVIDQETDRDEPWVVIVWNDPINLFEYVIFVLQTVFGHDKQTAERLTNDVHTKGRASVSSGSRTESELKVFQLHEYGLWATMQQD